MKEEKAHGLQWRWFSRLSSVMPLNDSTSLSIIFSNLLVTSHQMHEGKGYKQKSYKVVYPPLRSG